MRNSWLIGMGFLAILAETLAAGDTFPKAATIAEKDAVVHSGPSSAFMPTSNLSLGDKVILLQPVKDNPDWFAIKPPTGSFSWIDKHALTAIDQKTAYVDLKLGQVAQVFAGSMVVNQKPDVGTAVIDKSQFVTIIDRPLTHQEKTWYPIQPLASEVRYIHKSQVGLPATVDKKTAVQPPADELLLLRQRIEDLEKRLDQLEKRKKKRILP